MKEAQDHYRFGIQRVKHAAVRRLTVLARLAENAGRHQCDRAPLY